MGPPFTPPRSHRPTLSILPVTLSTLFHRWEPTEKVLEVKQKKITPNLEPTFPFGTSCPEFQSPVFYRPRRKVHKREGSRCAKGQRFPIPFTAGPRQSSGERGAVAALVLPPGDWQRGWALRVGKMLLPVCGNQGTCWATAEPHMSQNPQTCQMSPGGWPPPALSHPAELQRTHDSQ